MNTAQQLYEVSKALPEPVLAELLDFAAGQQRGLTPFRCCDPFSLLPFRCFDPFSLLQI